ncbi:major facilitator superfamily domain-containing protein [Mycotypha africana]|uniref:major facilitator superfamily domain-containing protein n=1 Tax=Mycotypha africana TaxID=64632 RepID=UPI002301693A|nr:major facilitator superfamily domain-containing protein [Mycotypha africana]KAI8979065.1 major facilitator superfamily domain-containing protein [Mycotypha africana]
MERARIERKSMIGKGYANYPYIVLLQYFSHPRSPFLFYISSFYLWIRLIFLLMPRFAFLESMFPTTAASMGYPNTRSSRSRSTTTIATASTVLLSDSNSENTATAADSSYSSTATQEIDVNDPKAVLVSNQQEEEKIKETALPKHQLFLLSIVLVCEPITASILFPFIYFMLRDFRLSDDEKEIGSYAGWITSMFFVAQFCTSLLWGKLSDRFGRRPVLLIGLMGNTICSCLFGLSKNLIWAISSRTLCGIMNGNMGVARTAVTEITDETNRTKAFSLFGLCYGLGLIGGYLSNPVDHFPNMFGHNQFLKNYPYFLPCFAAASISFVGLLVCYKYLNESSPYVLANNECQQRTERVLAATETTPLLNQKLSFTKSQTASSGSLKNVPRASYITILGFTVFTFHTLLFDEVLPLYFTAPFSAGGLGLTTREFASILTSFGILQLVFLSFIYPRLAKYFNTLMLCRLACVLLVIAYMLFPDLTFIRKLSAVIKEPFTSNNNDESWLFTASYASLLTVRFIAHITIHTTFSIMVSISAPPELIGVVNGVVSSALSLGRAISPTFGGMVWSYSLQKGQGYPFDHHLVYYIIAGMALFNVIHSYYIPASLALGGQRRQKSTSNLI